MQHKKYYISISMDIVITSMDFLKSVFLLCVSSTNLPNFVIAKSHKKLVTQN